MRAAVVGYGSAGSRHAELLSLRGVEVVVADPDPRRSDAAREAGLDTADLAEALAGAALAVVASPSHLHREHLERALAAGCDVLVEKPLATTSNGLDSVIEQARAEGRIVGIGNNLRFVEAIERAQEMFVTGALGRVIRARADFGFDLRRWRPGRDVMDAYSAHPEQGGGVLLDAIHEFDYLWWLFGEVSRVACVAGPRSSLGLEIDDVACTVLDFESGVVAEVALDFVSPVYRRGFELIGEEAVATWRWGDPAIALEDIGGARSLEVGPPGGMYGRLIDDFLAAVRERRDPRSTGEAGLAVLRIVEAAARASRDGKQQAVS
jgi:predicted dehydrogenase